MSQVAPFPSERRIVCGRCSTSFVCGSGGRDGRCWCADALARLAAPSAEEDCLCAACLRAALRQQGGDAACAPR